MDEQNGKFLLSLPLELKELLISFELSETITDISMRHGLFEETTLKEGIIETGDESKRGKLSTIIGDLLAGRLPLEILEETIKDDLKINSQVAKEIYADVKKDILTPVEKILESLYENRNKLIPDEYDAKQIWKIYGKLPEKLKETIFSEETTEHIYDICQKSGIKKTENILEINRIINETLMGILSPDELEKNLIKRLKLKQEIAKKINFGSYRFVFSPLKEWLNTLYETEIIIPGIIKPPRETHKDNYKEKIE